MNDIKETAAYLQTLLKEKGAAEYACSVSQSEKRELNTDLTEFSLYRTIFNQSASVTVIQEGRRGSSSGNDLTEAGLEKTVDDAMLSAASSMPDEANVIAEAQDPEVFRTGVYEPDMELFYDRLTEFLGDIKAQYPRINVLQLIGDHTQSHTLYFNSNGTRFEEFDGAYGVMLEMSASDGEKNTGLDYVQISTHDLTTPFLRQGNIAKHLADAEKSLESAEIKEKFEGAVILTPDCLGNFLYMLASNYIMGGVIMNGTSQWLNKLGQQVASDKITLTLKAQDERIVNLQPFTGDGYRAEDVKVIDKGVLNCFLLNLYAAKKTGRPVTKNTSFALVMEPGDKTLEEMVASIPRGLIVGGFSGGEPGANGEFSGVAKNSFYVENGKILGAVTETMINGNLENVFKNVLAISREQVCDGSTVLPYLACDGIVISGK